MTPSDITAWQDEFTNDPLSRGYSGMTPDQIHVDIAERRYTGDVPKWEIEKYLDFNLLTPVLEVAATNAELDAAVQGAARIATRLSQASYDTVSYAAGLGIATILFSGGLITDDQQAALIGLADNRKNRAEALELPLPRLMFLRDILGV